MKPWMKIAVGCLAVSIIAFFLFVAGVVGLGYWAKGKVEEVAGGGADAQAARKAANEVPFTRPAGDIIAEPRLVKFIEVRAAIFSVYEKYRGEIESRMARMKEGKSIDLSDISTGFTFIGEIQKAEALALARYGMPEREYEFINEQVYSSMWADFGPAHAGRRAIRQATEAAKTAARQAEAEGAPEEARAAIEQAGAEVAAELARHATPAENVALFKKYEAEIRKYAMPEMSFDTRDDAKPRP